MKGSRVIEKEKLSATPNYRSVGTYNSPSGCASSSLSNEKPLSICGRFILPIRVLSALLFACLLMPSNPGYSQTVTGNIVGTVTDATGSSITGARVVVTNASTGVQTTSVTDGAGDYSVRFLPIGNYTVAVSANGFKTQRIAPIHLELDKTAKINVSLKVGEVTTTEEVTAGSSQLLNTSDGSIGIVLSSKEIESVPLIANNYAGLAAFEPGSVNTDPAGFDVPERQTQEGDQTSNNGNRYQDNDYLLEGIPINENFNDEIGYNPAPEALAEFKVISANASAEYGEVGGGSMLAQLKSGTNHFHGSVYAHLQNQNLDANSWGNKFVTPIIPINPYTQTIFGGTLGGPITHKLFFFVDYEGLRSHTGGKASGSVLTSAMRNGDFSLLLNPPSSATSPNQAIQLYNTQDNFAPYPNNQITVTNPVAKFLIAHPSLYPLPNATPTDGIMQNNYQAGVQSYIVNNQGDIKIEWDPRNADKFTAFYTDSQPYDSSEAFLPVSFPSVNRYPTHIVGTSWVHTFSPAVVNLAHAGFTRIFWHANVPTDPSGQFGLNGDSIVGVPLPWAQPFVGFTAQYVGGLSGMGVNANIGDSLDNEFYYDDMLTWQRGKHLLSMGGHAMRIQDNFYSSNNYGFLGSMSYTGQFTSNPNVASGGVGYAPADFELNEVSEAQIGEHGSRIGTREWRWAAFIQDSWRIKPNLTLNLGVTYQYFQPWYEVHNRVADVILSGPNKGLVEYAVSVPEGAPDGSIVCKNRACNNIDNTALPRFSFAWEPASRWVVRGGYGATGNLEGEDTLAGFPPFQQYFIKQALYPTPTSAGTPFTVESGFSSPPGTPFYSTNGGLAAQTATIKPQFIQQWNLTLGYELNSNTSLSAGYVGEHGSNLGAYYNANQLTAPGATAPFAALVGQGGSLAAEGTWAIANYNALQVTFRQRMSHGFFYTVNYTYAKSLTNGIGFYGNGPTVNGSNGSAQNGYDWGADYGPSGWDIRHNVSAIASYALPFGRGMTFASNVNRIEDAVIGGWRASGSLILYSGYPIEINAPSESNVNSWGQSRANQYRYFKIRNRSLLHWWGTDASAVPCTQPGVNNGACAYGVPGINEFGTAAVNTERAPGYSQADLSAYKDFHIVEDQSFTFRADFFNAFNHPSYAAPNSNITSTNFGQITGVNSPPRHIQLSLMYSF